MASNSTTGMTKNSRKIASAGSTSSHSRLNVTATPAWRQPTAPANASLLPAAIADFRLGRRRARAAAGHTIDLGLVLHQRDAAREDRHDAETVAKHRRNVHGRFTGTKHWNRDRLASSLHAGIAHAIDHDGVNPVTLGLDDLGHGVRDG